MELKVDILHNWLLEESFEYDNIVDLLKGKKLIYD